jgi:small subunit ribosomal protein S16
MAVRIRLSRAGAKKSPHYRVIVADSRNPRDGRFLERVGTYHPLLPRDHPDRVTLKIERIKYWLEKGAKPSGRVATFLGAENLVVVETSNNPQKAKPKAKAQARLDELAKAAEEAKASEAETTAGDAPESTESSEAGSAPEPIEESTEVAAVSSEQGSGETVEEESAAPGTKTKEDG